MKYALISYRGDSNIGIFFKTSEKITLVPKNLEEDIKEKIEKILKTEVLECSIWNSSLLGIYSCMNSNGIILPKLIFEDELKFFKSLDLNIAIIESDYNALGNLILCNDNAAIVSPLIERDYIKEIRDALDVEVEVRKILKNNLVGSMAYTTNKGIFFNRNISEEEAKDIAEFFKVKNYGAGSINMGNVYVSIGIIANSNGLLVGEKSSPYEIQIVLESLDLL
ncbi:MAG: translation initiation factor IF-6 [Candidatus Aenigmatarchaeota archaeon]